MRPAWQPTRIALLHLISVRTGMVRRECYYILYAKASNTQHVPTTQKKTTPGGGFATLSRRSGR